MADILDLFDPLLWYRYRPSSGETLPQQPDLYRFQDGQVQPYQAPTGDPYDPLREYTGVSDLQSAFRAAGEGNYPAAAGYGALGTAGMVGALPLGAIGLAAKSARRGGDALSALDAAITKTRSAKELAANAAEPRFPQYAEVYPPTAPAVEKLKETQKVEGGTETFLSRQTTPEADAFMKERARIQKDMDTYGYEPFFKTEERYNVDPSNYPPSNVTTSTLQPATWETIKKYMSAIDAPETMKALLAAYDKGLTLGDPKDWYAMGQYEAGFIKHLGPEKGREAFLDRFAVPMAATTSGNDPQANLMTSHFLEYLRQTGQPMPTHGSQFPVPMYGQRMTSNLNDYLRMRAGEATGDPSGYAYLGPDQPKMHNFTRSFIGDLTQPVMDDQMARGLLAHRPELANSARTTAFGLLQQPVDRAAAEMGLLPGNLQDVAWTGFRGTPGKPMMAEINDSIERQRRLTGMSPEEIFLRAHVLKKIPMYGLPLTVGAGGLGGLGGTE